MSETDVWHEGGSDPFWQYCRDGYDFSTQQYAALDADEKRLWEHLPGLSEHGPHPDWVVVGGESMPGARPMHPNWARDLRDQCDAAGVPFFFKQWGNWAPDGDAPVYHGVPPKNHSMVWCASKKAAGRELDGRTWDQYPAGAR